jgi:sortase A
MRRFGWTRIFQNVLAVAGAVVLIGAFARLSEGWLFQWQPQLFTDASSGLNIEHLQATKLRNAIPPLSTLAAPAESVHGIRVVGRLEIHRLHVSTLVVEGDDAAALRLGVGHVPGSALGTPYGSGNTVLAGHRDTFFRCLRDIHVGDEVVLDIAGDLNRYRVTGLRIVPPSDVSVMKSAGTQQLTLITCYPFGFVGSAPNRLVVEAKPLSTAVLNAD